MAVPLITNLPPAPSRLETEETFVPKADALLGQLPTMVVEMNTGFQWVYDQNILIDIARNSTYAARDSAQSYSVIAVDAKVTAESAASTTVSSALIVGEAQAQTNALLGLGIGGSVVDNNGDLIMTYNDEYVTNLTINANGELTVTY